MKRVPAAAVVAALALLLALLPAALACAAWLNLLLLFLLQEGS
jgi:hypothetical protein